MRISVFEISKVDLCQTMHTYPAKISGKIRCQTQQNTFSSSSFALAIQAYVCKQLKLNMQM